MICWCLLTLGWFVGGLVCIILLDFCVLGSFGELGYFVVLIISGGLAERWFVGILIVLIFRFAVLGWYKTQI